MAHPMKKPALMTIDEFRRTEFGDERRWELIDGVPVAQAYPSPAHSAVQLALGSEIRSALRRRGSPCRAMTEVGIRPAFDPTHNYRVADVAVTCEPFDRDAKDTREPVLLVEVLSPSNEAEQRAKLHVYAAIPSVREILFIDSRQPRAELHRRDAAGRWPDGPTVLEATDMLELDTAGLRLPLAELYPG